MSTAGRSMVMVVVLLLLALLVEATTSFVISSNKGGIDVVVPNGSSSSSTKRGIATTYPRTTPTITTRPPLQMSSVPADDDDDDKKKDWLPPGPEDFLVMSGDVAALFVYTFLDHFLNEYYVTNMVAASSESSSALEFATQQQQQVPVWFDALHSYIRPETLLSMEGSISTLYSPAISTAGMAAVVMVACWIWSGYWSGAFLFRNTQQTQRRALQTTGTTWCIMAALIVLVAVTSDQVLGEMDVHNQILGGITKADADFIFDSLSVLVTWRYCVCWMLGSGRD